MAEGQRALAARDYARAERILSAALVKARGFDRDDLRLALTLSSLAQAHQGQREFVAAEPLYVEALDIVQRVRGPEHPDVAAILNNLGVLHRMHGQLPEAMQHLTRALDIKQQALGPSHPDVALTLMNLAQVYAARDDYEETLRLYRRSLDIYSQAFGETDARVAQVLDEYASLLRRLGRGAEADRLQARADAIRAGHATKG